MKPYHFFFLILVFACQKDKQAPANNASETFPIPIIWIDTQSVPIDSKEDYVDATIVIEGGDPNHNLAETTTMIKGRGNSTWSLGLEWGKNLIKLNSLTKQRFWECRKTKNGFYWLN